MNACPPRNSVASGADFMVVPLWLSSNLGPTVLVKVRPNIYIQESTYPRLFERNPYWLGMYGIFVTKSFLA